MTKKKTKTRVVKRKVKLEVMTPKHKDWNKFCSLLDGPSGCDFKQDAKGKITWSCDNAYTHTERILREHYPSVDISATLSYFGEHGGYCDCEILFNVDSEENFDTEVFVSCPECKKPFSKQESDAGYKVCEHCQAEHPEKYRRPKK